MPRMSAKERRAETVSKLIEAAIDTFMTRGYREASLEEIGDRAGYSTGAIYSNFLNKEALFVACVEQRAESQSEMWATFLTPAGEMPINPDSLGEALMAILPDPRWGRAQAEFRISFISDESRQAVLAGRRRWKSVMTELLRTVCSNQGWTPAVPLEEVAESAVALVSGLTIDAFTDPTLDIAQVFSSTISLLLQAQPVRTDAA